MLIEKTFLFFLRVSMVNIKDVFNWLLKFFCHRFLKLIKIINICFDTLRHFEVI